MAQLTPEQFNQVKAVFDAKNIPEYIWVPIMMSESGGNTGSNLSNSIEDSRGLFQINIKANPQYKGVNLYDPVTNATIARDHFIAPAYAQAQYALPSGSSVDIASYVYKNGIRPKWTSSLASSFAGKVNNFLKGGASAIGLGSGGSGAQTGATSTLQDAGNAISNGASTLVNNLIDRFKAFSWNLVPLLLGLIVLILVLYKMFASGSDTINITMPKGGKENE